MSYDPLVQGIVPNPTYPPSQPPQQGAQSISNTAAITTSWPGVVGQNNLQLNRWS